MQKLIPQIQSWWLLWLATVITMSIVAASQLFTDRISLLLDRQASELLAADLMLRSNEAIPDSYMQMVEQYGLNRATTIQLRTAIFINDEPQLIELKAVSDEYPLRGKLERRSDLFAPAEKVTSGPRVGEVWVDNKLSEQLNQPIELGMTTLPARWNLSYEPDRGGSLFNLAPRVMMHLDDLNATGLLVPGSRARYSLLVAGEVEAIKDFAKAVKPLLVEGQSLQTLNNARPEMRTALDRTSKFFALAIVMTLVIAMVAIAITARYAASQESTKVAVMRTFGIASQRLLRHYLVQVLKIWMWSLPAGLLLGLLAQFPLQWALGFWFDARLPQASLWPYALAGLVGLISLIGFSLPPLVNVIDTPPMQVLRQTQHSLSRFKSLMLSLVSFATLFVVLLLIVSDIQIAALLFLLVLVTAAIIPFMLKVILLLLNRLTQKQFWLRSYVLSRLLSHNRNALFVMSGFSLALLSVLLISLVKDQLMADWEQQLPETKANYFLVNIPTRDVEALTGYLQSADIPSSEAYALVRARLTEINQQDVKSIQFENERAYRLLNHTFNLSYTENLPPDNEVVEGDWLGEADTPAEFSVEQGMAQDMGLKLGDELKFSLAGSEFDGVISSIRSVVWENFQPNFYIIGTQSELSSKPQTWLLSAFVEPDNRVKLKPLIQQFPTVTLLDISEVMTRIKGIIDRASLALEFFFIFALVAAIIVLLSALNTANHDREMEIALLQALGADKKQKLKSQVIEFVLMGTLVGAFAAVFATLIGAVIGMRFFDLPFVFSSTLWVYSISSAVAVITTIGSLFIYRSFSVSPMRLLRS